MQLKPTITFRGIRHSQRVEAEIRKRIKKLETYYSSIIGCRVLIEFAQRHHEAGNRIHVRIALTVPGDEIVVSHEASLHGANQAIDREKPTKMDEPDAGKKHALVAVREAFDAARRKLQDFARQQRGAVKTPSRRPRGRVSQLFAVDEYGYIEAPDGHEVYFQKSSVLKNGFPRLRVGTTVSYVEEAGEKGPQASTIRLAHPRARRHVQAAPAH